MIQAEGTENNIKWFLDWRGDTMIIHVEKEDNPKEFIEEIYEFEHKPIFGFDVSDIDIINRKLDAYIVQLGKE